MIKNKILLTNADICEELGDDIELIRKAEFGWNLYAKLLSKKLKDVE